ncbi:MAG: signal peptidase II [Candidatus Omnitrophota bacterium]
MNRKRLFFFLIPAIFLLDRVLKILVIRFLSEGEGFPVIPGIFHVTRVNNTGAAFGILRGNGAFLILISALCIAFLVFYLLKNSFRGLAPVAWSLVLAGALGNLYDRLRYGYVVDFLDLRVWPVFNAADVSICLGAFLIVLHLFKPGRAEGRK